MHFFAKSLDDFLYFFSQLATVLNHVEEVPWSVNTGGMGLDKEAGRSIEVHEARDDLLKSLGGVWGRHILSQETTGRGDPTCHTKWTRCLVLLAHVLPLLRDTY